MKTTASREYTSVFLYMELRSEWNISETEKNCKKKGNVNGNLKSH